MGEGLCLGQLQSFLEVARLGNVTRAADGLFLTQPALSARLKRLEHEVGTSLFVRDHKGARLNDAGRAFLPYAERVVEVVAEAERALAAVRDGPDLDLVIAATHSMNLYVLPPVICRFVTAHPTVRLSVHTAPSEEVLQLVASGEAHLGLGRLLHHTDVEATPLYDEAYVLAVPRGHPLASMRTVSLADLADQTLVTLFRSRSINARLWGILVRAGVQHFIDLDNPEVAKRVVSDRQGVVLLPHTAADRELEDGSLCRIELDGGSSLHRTMAALRRRGTSELAVVDDFLDLLSSHAAELELDRYNKQAPRRRPIGASTEPTSSLSAWAFARVPATMTTRPPA